MSTRSAPLWLSLTLLALALPAQSAPVARAAHKPPPLQFGYRDGAESICIEVAGDQLTATCNGKPLAKERLHRQDDRVLLYGPRYELTAQLLLWSGGGSLQVFADKRPMVIGFTLQVPTPDEVRPHGVEPMNVRKVLSVRPGLPAAKAGIAAGDLLLQVDGQPLVTETRLRALLLDKKPGDEVRLLLLRGEARLPCTVRLEPATTAPGMFGFDAAAAHRYVQGLRALGADREAIELAGRLGVSRVVSPPLVHVDGGRMLVMSGDGTAAAAAAGSATANGGATGDERQELQQLQQRLDQMERMLQQLIELRSKDARRGDGNK